MLSGRRLDLLDPSPLDIEIEDIAHGLARVARWNGQTRGDHAFSVAEHCLVVEAILGKLEPQIETRWRLVALLHDAPEYVIGDMISPFKAALGVDYKDFEARLEGAIHIRFGLPALTPVSVQRRIKVADRVSAFFEATQIAGFDALEAEAFFGAPPAGLEIKIESEPPARAQRAFLKRFDALYRATHGEPPKAPSRIRRGEA
jgi:5'-deoxynucleotidase YfbR-like HD superfamily hydrolase